MKYSLAIACLLAGSQAVEAELGVTMKPQEQMIAEVIQ